MGTGKKLRILLDLENMQNIEKSNSEGPLPIVLVDKKDSGLEVCGLQVAQKKNQAGFISTTTLHVLQSISGMVVSLCILALPRRMRFTTPERLLLFGTTQFGLSYSFAVSEVYAHGAAFFLGLEVFHCMVCKEKIGSYGVASWNLFC